MLDDEVAVARPWGFLVADIRVPVMIRHGDDDRFVSVKQGRWLAEHVADATYRELAGEGHISVAVRSIQSSRRC